MQGWGPSSASRSQAPASIQLPPRRGPSETWSASGCCPTSRTARRPAWGADESRVLLRGERMKARVVALLALAAAVALTSVAAAGSHAAKQRVAIDLKLWPQ